jgi:hypothetical protein
MLIVTASCPERLFFQGEIYTLRAGMPVSGQLGAYMENKGWAKPPRKKKAAPENKARKAPEVKL